MFQGWPVSKVPDHGIVTERLMTDFAGNAVALPVLLALVLSTLTAITWTDPAPQVHNASTDDEVADALRIFEDMNSHQ